METLDIGHGLGNFVKRVTEIKPDELAVPPFYIAGWPKVVGDIHVSVRKFGFCYRVKDINGRLVRLYKWFCLGFLIAPSFSFSIKENGTIEINTDNSIGPMYSYVSREVAFLNTLRRANTLLLFNQLEDKALPKVIKKVERDLRNNQEVIELVKKALEPFIPQIVADVLEGQN